MNILVYIRLYCKIEKIPIVLSGRYSFDENQISYAYQIPINKKSVCVKKTKKNTPDKTNVFSYVLTVTSEHGKKLHEIYGVRAEKIFNMLLNREHAR